MANARQLVNPSIGTRSRWVSAARNLRAARQSQYRDRMQSLSSLLTALTWTEVALGVGFFLLSAVVSLAAVAWVLSRLPANYFRGKHPPPLFGEGHPVLGWVVRVGKNLAGVALIALGVVLSLPGIPGQGLLTIFLGLLLIDYPGKRRLEKWLVRQPRIKRAIDAVRAARGRPPLELDAREAG